MHRGAENGVGDRRRVYGSVETSAHSPAVYLPQVDGWTAQGAAIIFEVSPRVRSRLSQMYPSKTSLLQRPSLFTNGTFPPVAWYKADAPAMRRL